jgi:hypothetical protein
MRMRISIAFILIILIYSCTGQAPELKTGTWRVVLEMQGQQLPFRMDVEKKGNAYQAYLINATERILLDEITFQDDSVTIKLHVFDAALKAKVDGETLTGTFVKYYAPSGSIPFTAKWGEDFRFTKEPVTSLRFFGKYQVQFFTEKDTTQAVALLDQKENHITGSFLTPIGDYRLAHLTAIMLSYSRPYK